MRPEGRVGATQGREGVQGRETQVCEGKGPGEGGEEKKASVAGAEGARGGRCKMGTGPQLDARPWKRNGGEATETF